MVKIVEGGPELFDGLAFGSQHPGTLQFLQNAPQVATERLNAAGSWFIQQTKNLVDRVASSEAMRLAKAAQRFLTNVWQTDTIRTLNTIGELQHPPNTMLRWLAAEPQVSKRIQEQTLDGWSGRYVQPEGVRHGEHNYDYRRVMDGIVQVSDDDEAEHDWTSVNYFEDVEPEDNLELHQQEAILRSWDALRHQLQYGSDDPTSPWNASL